MKFLLGNLTSQVDHCKQAQLSLFTLTLFRLSAMKTKYTQQNPNWVIIRNTFTVALQVYTWLDKGR